MPVPVPYAQPLISLAEARAHLNYRSGKNVDDDEIEEFLAGAFDVVEALTEPLGQRTVTDRVAGSPTSAVLVLKHCPTMSVVSMAAVPNTHPGLPTDLSTCYLDKEAGTFTRYDGSGWPPALDAVTVIGRSTLPPSLRLAVLEQLAHTWQNSQQAGGPSGVPEFDAEETSTVVANGTTYSVPNRVRELCLRYPRTPQMGGM